MCRFSKIVMPTLGVDFSAKNLQITDNINIRLHLWDVAGAEFLESLPPLYCYILCNSQV